MLRTRPLILLLLFLVFVATLLIGGCSIPLWGAGEIGISWTTTRKVFLYHAVDGDGDGDGDKDKDKEPDPCQQPRS